MKKSLFLTLFAACLLLAACQKKLPPAKAASDFSGPEFRGEIVYSHSCAKCHYAYKSSDLQGPGLAGIFNKEYLQSGAPATDERVRAVITSGRHMMPGTSLSDDQMDDLIAYLHTL